MRASTTTIKSQQMCKAKHILLAVAVCSLAIAPAANAEPSSSPNFAETDTGYSSVNSITPPVDSANSSGGSTDVDGYSSLNSITGPRVDAPTLVSSSPTGAGEGFDWPSALVGAGGALALIALGGATLLTLRRRGSVAPSVSTS